MGLVRNTHTFLKSILKIGVSEELSFSEKIQVELSNLFTLVSLPALSIHLAYNFWGPNESREYLLAVLFIFILSLTLYLNYHQRFLLAKIHSLLTTFMVLITLHFLFGSGLRQEPMYLLLVLISFYYFDRKYAVLISLLILISYITVSIYTDLYGPWVQVEILPTAPYGYFIFAVSASLTLTWRLLDQNRNFYELSRTQKEKLELKNEELERFNYMVSHDLKSPLRNVISFSSLIERDLKKGEKEKLPDYLHYLKSNARYMAELMEGILEISRLKIGEQESMEELDLNRVLKKVLVSIRKDIRDANARVFSAGLPRYPGNATHFILLLQNLIQNGIKYNEQEIPTIHIWASQNENSIQIHVTDNGIGIDEEYHEYVFKYFKRLHGQGKYEGSGLGLALCKKIVESYQGKISISPNPKGGSRFTIYLPLKS